MLKTALIILVLAVLGVGGFFVYQNFQSNYGLEPTPTPQTIVSSPSSDSGFETSTDPCEVLTKGSSDVPPLYREGITWQEPKITEYEVPLAEGSQRGNGCLIQSLSVDLDLSDRVRDSYTREFENRKWEIESAGDMPGAGFVTWKKGMNYFVLRVDSTSNLDLKAVLLFYYK